MSTLMDLIRYKIRLEKQLKECEARIKELEDQIERLEETEEEAEFLRKEFRKRVEIRDRKLLEEKYYWRGEKANDFMAIYADAVLLENTDYRQLGTEKVETALENKITRLKNELEEKKKERKFLKAEIRRVKILIMACGED